MSEQQKKKMFLIQGLKGPRAALVVDASNVPAKDTEHLTVNKEVCAASASWESQGSFGR